MSKHYTINYLYNYPLVVDICLSMMDDSNVMQKCNEMEAGTLVTCVPGTSCVAGVILLVVRLVLCTKQLI